MLCLDLKRLLLGRGENERELVVDLSKGMFRWKIILTDPLLKDAADARNVKARGAEDLLLLLLPKGPILCILPKLRNENVSKVK